MLYLEAPFKYFRTLGKETELLVKSSSYKKKKSMLMENKHISGFPENVLEK